MREIKFRAWDGIRMTDSGIMYNNSNRTLEVIKGSILMQYTGLKDKNGVEIYEGDVIHYDEDVKSLIGGKISHSGEVKQVTALIVWSSHFACFKARFKSVDSNSMKQVVISPHKLEKIEVIGNIHENPDLL